MTKISDASLVSSVTGNEKLPTGEPGDKAISVDQIKDFVEEDLGSAAFEDVSAFDASGAAATAENNAKAYADNLVQGLKWKPPVEVATTVDITLSGEQTIDGVTTDESRVLVKNQSDQTENGIYVSGTGAWTRTADANTAEELEGATVVVQQGTDNADTTWAQTTDNINLGSSNIIFTPVGVVTPDATETVKGKAELTDQTEAEAAGNATSSGTANHTNILTGRGAWWFFEVRRLLSLFYRWIFDINPQTGTTYTLALADAGKIVTCSNTSPITVTIPLNSTAAFAIGSRIRVQRINTGAVTIAATGGVTINAEDAANLVIRKQYGYVDLVKMATDTWQLIHSPSSFWEWIKTQAQTFTAALTATDLTATNQAGTGNRLAIVDSAGKFLRYSNVSIDTTTGEIDIDGLDSLEATKTLRVLAQGVEQFAVTNNFKTIFAHNGSVNITVPDAITSGNAKIVINDDQEDALAVVDKVLNRYTSYRTTENNLAVIVEQSQEHNYGEGFTVKTFQKRITTSTANAGWNTILSIPIAADQAMSIHVDHLLALATDGSRLIAYGDKDGVGYRDGSNNTSIDAPTMTMRGTLISSSGGACRMAPDDTDEEIDIDFQNTATGKTFDVFLQVTVIVQDLPV